MYLIDKSYFLSIISKLAIKLNVKTIRFISNFIIIKMLLGEIDYEFIHAASFILLDERRF
ncbi:hypothetical protein ATO12_18955 [Aquimarina atlantica]|uniref:Uncharacterized protein n=1 Tax=Aquimarina atlantica TaxID=1317122 RepID=A0A023BSW7_9FLAO|nr:hypothetical protein ATO12_18955 [Aquimarina atlantica]